ncbi:hypothetical protein Csa_023962, partial [Cucumis sativus]
IWDILWRDRQKRSCQKDCSTLSGVTNWRCFGDCRRGTDIGTWSIMYKGESPQTWQ